MNEVIQTIFQRRSTRLYQTRQVEVEKIDLLLQAAMAAPNACNSQPWEFVLITDEISELPG
jgi:nitroreductase